ncbi:hypothetical protein [Aureimonas glaciei]|uniref:Uncharacterized protein n=1 Tax=Aureimonas glaciei TaxID=1776957 RepID=A0A917DDU2_9HYPH|nr:hypothetical protein [Aureimonas glaciei]GGD28986.1 hypothetical protein GCM10011335_35170 [Aureimonas glaciei]
MALLREHYPSAPLQALEGLIGQPLSKIKAKANRIGIVRTRSPLKRTGIRILDLLLSRCREKHITMRELDRLAGTGTFFEKYAWLSGKLGEKRRLQIMARANKGIRALGGRVIARWPEVED